MVALHTEQLILVNSFMTRSKAMEYYALFQADKGKLRGVNDKGYQVFAISQSNYALLFKNKDLPGYLDFFGANYGGGK